MTADSRVRIIALLARQQPKAIFGIQESEWVDFKTVGPNGPYDLSTDKGKFELAKDVAAFANTGGGLIVCGFRAKRRPTDLHEAAQKETPFAKRLVNTDTYKDVITEYVRPLISVDFHWFEDPSDPDLGYFVIEVQALPESDRWALVVKTLSEDGKLAKGGVAIPRRHSDKTPYLTPDEVYQLVNAGLRGEPKMDVDLSVVTGAVPDVEVTDAVVERLLANRRRKLLASLPRREAEASPRERRASLAMSDGEKQLSREIQRLRDLNDLMPNMMSRDRRTPQQYRAEVDAYLEACGRQLPSMLRRMWAQQSAPLVLRLTNRSDVMVHQVEVIATVGPEYTAVLWSRPSGTATTPAKLPWPEPPAAYGSKSLLASWGAHSSVPALSSSFGVAVPGHRAPAHPRIRQLEDRLVIRFPPVDLRAHAQLPLDPVLLYRNGASTEESVAVRWTATCTNLKGRQEDVVHVPVEPLSVTLPPDADIP
ncbi:ATP-binding protein [Streptomyces sp. NPDC048281]|uniref:AlbA family DNA-binding domain-containing protein n=1 Tax=Streptomyces sp. NPDC048281 TaxID=3154715 RepID=UPI003449B3A1